MLCGCSVSWEFLCCHVQSHLSSAKHLFQPRGSFFFFTSVWVLSHISRFKMPSISTHTLLSSCPERLPSWQLKKSTSLVIVTDALRNCWWVHPCCYVARADRVRGGVLPSVNRITGSSPLFTVCSGPECFPHLHIRYLYSESVSVRLWWCCQGDGWWDLYDGKRIIHRFALAVTSRAFMSLSWTQQLCQYMLHTAWIHIRGCKIYRF